MADSIQDSTAPGISGAALQARLRTASPRYLAPPTPLASVLIHGGVLALWVVLLARAFDLRGVLAWSAGLAYVAYDTALLVFTFLGTLRLARGPVETPAGGGGGPTIAVLVAAHDEASVLAATLTALLAQGDVPERIVLVDDGSTDGTASVMAGLGLGEPGLGEMRACGRLWWLRLPRSGKAAALNAALPLVDEEVVLTVDADTLLEPDAVAAMRAAFAAAPLLVAAGGVLTPVCGPGVSGWCLQWFQEHEYLRNFLSRYAWMGQDGLLLISGAFAGFRRAAVLEVGGFDPDCLVEDYELIHRLRRQGVLHGLAWTTAVLGRARARTDAPATLGAFLRQRRRWFGGFLQTQYWYRDMVGNRRFGRLGLRMLPVKAADTLQPIYGLTAVALLAFYLATGRWRVLLPVGGVIGAKLVFDLAFHAWSVRIYRRWAGGSGRVGMGTALVAAVIEPFSFQILRHLGAAWGWVAFLSGNISWGKARGAAP